MLLYRMDRLVQAAAAAVLFAHRAERLDRAAGL
jgi:hypothetical protein